jgi:LPXTG-motif cell wall-anchored protein
VNVDFDQRRGQRPRAARLIHSRIYRMVGCLLGALMGLTLLSPAPASAQSGEMGVATIRSRSGEPIDGGGSATEFTIDLPDGAECPGDSFNDDYRVGSYMLPATVDPFEVEWSGEGPHPYGLGDYESFRQPLYDDLTSGYSSKLLAENDGPGQPGQILDFPAFTMDVFEPGMIAPGRYRIGIVCNYFAEVSTVWNAEIEVVTDAQDAPAQIHWTVVDAQGAAPESGSSTASIVVVGLVVLLLGGLAAFIRRKQATSRRHRTEELR